MSNEIKQGDKVRVSKDAPWIYTPDWVDAMFDLVLKVIEVEDGNAMVEFAKRTPYRTVLTTIPTKYLIKVDAEAKEPKYHKDDKVCINKSSLKHGLRGEILTIIGVDVSDRTYYVQSRRMRSPIWLREDEISPYTEPTEQTEAEKKPNIGSIKIPVEVDLSDSYWDAYAADLAKEIVLKTVNSASDRRPSAIAEYAVSVAKAVVEGLKRK